MHYGGTFIIRWEQGGVYISTPQGLCTICTHGTSFLRPQFSSMQHRADEWVVSQSVFSISVQSDGRRVSKLSSQCRAVQRSQEVLHLIGTNTMPHIKST
jgi:hypothetical protein